MLDAESLDGALTDAARRDALVPTAPELDGAIGDAGDVDGLSVGGMMQAPNAGDSTEQVAGQPMVDVSQGTTNANEPTDSLLTNGGAESANVMMLTMRLIVQVMRLMWMQSRPPVPTAMDLDLDAYTTHTGPTSSFSKTARDE